MTPARLRHCLDALDWSQRGLARILNRQEGTVRQWARGAVQIPQDVAAWLEIRTRHAEKHPAPRRQERDAPLPIAGIENAYPPTEAPVADRLNILVAGRFSDSTPSGGETYNAVYVRYSYSDVSDEVANGRPISLIVPVLEVWRDGALHLVTDWDGIRAAVAELRRAWGNLPCQVNETRDFEP